MYIIIFMYLASFSLQNLRNPPLFLGYSFFSSEVMSSLCWRLKLEWSFKKFWPRCVFVMHKWVVAFYGTLCGFRLRSTCGTIWKRFIWLYEILERKIRHMKYNMYHKIPSYGNFIKRHLKTETIQFVY